MIAAIITHWILSFKAEMDMQPNVHVNIHLAAWVVITLDIENGFDSRLPMFVCMLAKVEFYMAYCCLRIRRHRIREQAAVKSHPALLRDLIIMNRYFILSFISLTLINVYSIHLLITSTFYHSQCKISNIDPN